MDHMEASCVIYVKVGRFDQSKQNTISVLTITALGIVMLTVHYDIIVSMWFMSDPGNILRQTSTNILYVTGYSFYIYQTWDLSCHSSWCVPGNKHTISDRLTEIAQPLESPAAIHNPPLHSRIRLELNVQVGCHSFHFDLYLTIVSSALPTSFHDHLPHVSTTASYSSRNTSPMCDGSQINPHNRCFKQYVTQRDTAATQTPISPPRHCNCSSRHMTQDPHLKKVHNTGSSKNKKLHVIECESIHICVHNGQLRI
jgi:hypothetical protein